MENCPIKLDDWSPSDIMVFRSPMVEYLRIESDGTVKLCEGVTTTDEASQKFWETVLAQFPHITAAAEKRGRIAGLREAAEMATDDIKIEAPATGAMWTPEKIHPKRLERIFWRANYLEGECTADKLEQSP